MVDEGGFESQVPGRVETGAFVLRGLGSRFADGQKVKLSVVSLVQKDFVPNLLDDNVPRVDGAGAAHQGGQDRVGGKHVDVGLALGQFPDDGVVGGRHRVENTVDALQRTFRLDVDSVVSLVVKLHRSTLHTGKQKERCKNTFRVDPVHQRCALMRFSGSEHYETLNFWGIRRLSV